MLIFEKASANNRDLKPLTFRWRTKLGLVPHYKYLPAGWYNPSKNFYKVNLSSEPLIIII